MMEEYAYVIDYSLMGKIEDIKREPLVYLVGEESFILLEAVLKKGAEVEIGERIYVGKFLEKRDKIDRIKGKIKYEDLPQSAKSELKEVVKKIVKNRENVFLKFLNECAPISIRLHSLELLPGIGKKHMNLILEEREKKKFDSLKDFEERVKISDIAGIISERIVQEIQGGERHYLFVKPQRR
jgi:putative nucleotide binding protein